MKVSILGTDSLDQISRRASLSKRAFGSFIEEVGRLLAKKGVQIIIVPDSEIALEIARAYKENNGRRVIGLVPSADEKFEKKHRHYLDLIDRKVEYSTWFNAIRHIVSMSDYSIVMGLSSPAISEIQRFKYLLLFFSIKTKLLVFKNTLSKKIPKAIEEELPIIYVTSIKDLEKFIG